MTNIKSSLHRVRCGNQGSPRLLLIHGNMASANWWKPVMQRMNQDFELLAVDLRGFGQSSDSPENITLTDHAADLQTLLEEEDFKPAVVVGHSLGGAVAMELAFQAPHDVAALILVDSAPIRGMTDIQYELLEQVQQQDELMIASLKGTMIQELDEQLWLQFAQDCLRAKAALIPNTKALDGAEFREKAQAFKKPVLLVHGEKDLLVPLAMAEEAKQYYANSFMQVIAECGHAPQVEQPKQFVKLVSAFLANLKE